MPKGSIDRRKRNVTLATSDPLAELLFRNLTTSGVVEVGSPLKYTRVAWSRDIIAYGEIIRRKLAKLF